jgi:hypothetical protein
LRRQTASFAIIGHNSILTYAGVKISTKKASTMGASASREKFRESVAALIEVDVSADDAEFWDELWKIPSSAEEVFELISPEAARKLRDDRFDNLATLFTQATAQLCQIVETPYNIYFDQALNCVRVLTRVLPFLLEKGKFFYFI